MKSFFCLVAVSLSFFANLTARAEPEGAKIEDALAQFRKNHPNIAAAAPAYETLVSDFSKNPELVVGGEAMKEKQSIRYLNRLLLLLSEIRLGGEIAALEAAKPGSKPWMTAAEQARLRTKDVALTKIRSTQSLLARIPDAVPILVRDLRRLNEALGTFLLRRDAESGARGRDAAMVGEVVKLNGVTRDLLGDLAQKPRLSDEAYVDALGTLGQLEKFEESIEDLPDYTEIVDFKELVNDLHAALSVHGRQAEFLKLHEADLIKEDFRKREVEAFFTDLGVDAKAVVDPAIPVDLSDRFHAPRSQGHDFSCVAQALTSDMGTHTQNPLSANFAFGLMTWSQRVVEAKFDPAELASGKVTNEQLEKASAEFLKDEKIPDDQRLAWRSLQRMDPKAPPSLITFANRGIFYPLAIRLLEIHGIPTEADFGSPARSFIVDSLQAVPGRTFVVDKIADVDQPMTFVEIKRLLDAGHPLEVSIGTDAREVDRETDEDWVRILPAAPNMLHVVNVVGTGEGFDPFDNVKKRYFIIRDSFTAAKFHYKTSVASFLPFMAGAVRVKSVRQLDAPVTYAR